MGRRRKAPKLRVHPCVEDGHVIREAMVMESARSMRMRMWMCDSARGLVLGRVFWRILKMQCGDKVLGDQRQSGGDGWVNGGNHI